MRNSVPSPARRKHAGAWLVMAVCLVLTGCSASWDRAPEPKPSRTAPLDTIAAAAEGDHLVLTASVSAVLGDRAFVVRDVDLPEGGLLVLAPVAVELRAPDLVTVDGEVRRFSYQAFQASFGLPDQRPYEPFENRKVMVAANVRSFG